VDGFLLGALPFLVVGVYGRVEVAYPLPFLFNWHRV
jgi:hypothetical protein